ncbi:Ig-like domain-containing protein [Agromyces sp. NPDC058104]|uniref:Ig-like domain-containing protein n=1 Tax=Agromyces sp. NPDC058104 TaxID=3346342 RepID=UPI0036DB9A14
MTDEWIGKSNNERTSVLCWGRHELRMIATNMAPPKLPNSHCQARSPDRSCAPWKRAVKRASDRCLKDHLAVQRNTMSISRNRAKHRGAIFGSAIALSLVFAGAAVQPAQAVVDDSPTSGNPLEVRVDGVDPAPAALAAPPAPLISTPAEDSSLNSSTPTIGGTAEADSTITVTIDTAVVGTTTSDETGNWLFNVDGALSLEDGEHSVSATATNAGAETSVPSATVTFTTDTVAPGRPTITSPAAGATVASSRPLIAGTADAHEFVDVTIDGVAAGRAVVDSLGSWAFTPATGLPNGAHLVSVRVRDAAGNISLARTATFTVAVPAPIAPVLTSPANGSETTERTPTISGTAEMYTTITITLDGEIVGTTTTDAGESWSFDIATELSAGAHSVSATATNEAGLTGPASATTTFTVNVAAPTPTPSETPEPDEETEGNSAIPTEATGLANTGMDLVAAIASALVAIAAGLIAFLVALRRKTAE